MKKKKKKKKEQVPWYTGSVQGLQSYTNKQATQLLDP